MPDLSARPTGSDDAAHSPSLTDRVLARVHDAGKAADRRARTTRPRSARRRSASDPLAAELTRTPEEVREARSLRRVFEDLGVTYRQYRRQTGAPISPAVRAAASRFRKELSVPSLVSVAGQLEELHILDW